MHQPVYFRWQRENRCLNLLVELHIVHYYAHGHQAEVDAEQAWHAYSIDDHVVIGGSVSAVPATVIIKVIVRNTCVFFRRLTPVYFEIAFLSIRKIP